MNKTARLITASFCIVLAGVIGFYQFKLSNVKGNKQVVVVVAKNNIFRGDEITSDKITTKKIDSASVVEGGYSSPGEITGKIATENFRSNEQILASKIATKEKWAEGEMRLVSITCNPDKDTFTANEVRPLDKVDIYFIPNQPQINPAQTIPLYPMDSTLLNTLKPILEKVEILDVKSAEGISYKDKVQGQAFVPKSAIFMAPKDIADKIQTYKALGGYFSLSISGQRPSIEGNKKVTGTTTTSNNNGSSVIFK
ncbi:SAF domain-containing protein [Clostridium magnum]|nr:SAF domain-containing protein [Clostridium magnum]SHJ40299.1 Flp pilus assembly protein CpaB [Clostridium magnum DSM 2767]